MSNLILNRKQYLNNELTHDEYYDQFVTRSQMELVLRAIPLWDLVNKDPNLNDIPLKRWDQIGVAYDAMQGAKSAGEFYSKGFSVCVAKAATRRILAQYHQHQSICTNSRCTSGASCCQRHHHHLGSICFVCGTVD